MTIDDIILPAILLVAVVGLIYHLESRKLDIMEKNGCVVQVIER